MIKIIYGICFFLCLNQLYAQDLLAQEVQLINKSGDTLYGLNTFSSKTSKPYFVLIIAGSGPTDRNGNNPIGGENNSLKMIAEALEQSQIASIRYDKRGIGKSKNAAKNEMDTRFDDMVDDAIAWVSWIKQNYPEKKIVIAGHSEGSLIGMIAANKTNAEKYISIAGAGFSADSVLKQQLSSVADFIRAEAFKIIDELKKGNTVEKVDPLFLSLFRPSVQPYLISWFKYNPCEEIKKIKGKVLIVNGDNDIQVGTEHAEELKRCKEDAQLQIIPEMNHVLKNAPRDRKENIATYKIPDLALNEEFVRLLTNFILKN
jgi:alpha/beta superfamily hydrolase